MTTVLILQEFAPELEHTSGAILEHVAALHALGVEIVVSVSGKGGVLADCLEDRGIPFSKTYSDISVEKPGTIYSSQPLAGTGNA